MLAHAIELELQDFLTKHSELLVNHNKSMIVRNGYLPERKITTGIGYIELQHLSNLATLPQSDYKEWDRLESSKGHIHIQSRM